MKRKGNVEFLYTIQHPCSMTVWFTSDPVKAEHASRNGCIVTSRGIAFNEINKIFKGTQH